MSTKNLKVINKLLKENQELVLKRNLLKQDIENLKKEEEPIIAKNNVNVIYVGKKAI